MVVELAKVVGEIGKREEKWQEKKLGRDGFVSTLASRFFMLKPCNPPLFIRDKRGQSCLHWENYWPLI